MSDRITVTAQEFRQACSVWLAVMPKRVWKRIFDNLYGDPKKRGGDYDPSGGRKDLAKYIESKMAEASWTVSRPPIRHIAGGRLMERPSDAEHQDAGDVYVPGGIRDASDVDRRD